VTLHSKTYICLSGFGHCETNYQENKMRKLLLSTAAIGIIAASGASAQVLASFDNIVDEIMQESDVNFIGAALNDADINGNINITVEGQSGENDRDYSDIYTRDFLDADAGFSGFLGIGATEGSATADFITDSLVDVSSSLANTTTVFGNMTTLAAGAVNDVDVNVEGFGGEIVASGAAGTATTWADADFAALGGEGITGLVFAGNEGEIFGQIELELTGGNFTTGNLSATAVGAVNSGDISASLIGSTDDLIE